MAGAYLKEGKKDKAAEVLSLSLEAAKNIDNPFTKAKAFAKIAGAVGCYGNISPEVEERALFSLGLRPEIVATQVVPRDRHAAFVAALAAGRSVAEGRPVMISEFGR